MSAIAFFVLLAAGLNVWVYVELTGHLEAKHHLVWEQLGQPSVHNDYRNFFQATFRFLAFVYSGSFWKRGDPRLRSLGWAFLGCNLQLFLLSVEYFSR